MMPDSPQPSISFLLRKAQASLVEAVHLGADEARVEASMLLCRALGDVNRAWLIAHEQDAVSPEQRAAFDALLQRRMTGEPIAYILGEREFYGLSFKVTPAVLIPRPETELLVELALQRLPQHGRLLDLGTGSGAIALSLAHERPDAQVTAVDASSEVLEVAQVNAMRLKLDNVRLLHSDWFSTLHGERYDIIVSNPPYIAANDPHLHRGDLRFEPLSALSSGRDGLDAIRLIAGLAPSHLESRGWLMMEHGYDQAVRVQELLKLAGFSEVFTAPDLAGIERVSGGYLA